MMDVQKFREEGFIYDDIRNYSELINFDDIKNMKEKIDLIPYKRYSKYDYWFMYNKLSYIEELFYEDYLKYIMGLTKFTEKYGSGDVGLAKFVDLKMVDFIKTFNQDISVSQPFAKRLV